MSLSLKIARRYLFAKKSTNAINVISGITVLGIAVGSAALILFLSVFNGLEDLLAGLYSSFDPDVKVTPAEGKTFTLKDKEILDLQSIEGIAYVSKTLEEIALFEYKGSQNLGIIKGVEENYRHVTSIDSVMQEGYFSIKDGVRNMAIVGYGMQNKLSISIEDYLSTIAVYMVKQKKTSIDQPFRKRYLYPGGSYMIQARFDEKYVLTNLDFVQELRGYYNGEISALEIKLEEGTNSSTVIPKIKKILGNDFEVKNQYQQNAAFFKLMNVEKWMGYAVVGLALLLVGVNMIGALLMIVLDKKKDIAILKSMGANETTIRNIFLLEGLLLSLLGMFIGFCVAIILYVLQKKVGIIQMHGFIVDTYPISMRVGDFVVVFLTVIIIAGLFSWIPARRAAKMETLIGE